MAVIVEFTIPAEAFPFGRAVGGDPTVQVVLERTVPFGRRHIPFLWVTNHDFEVFERTLTESELVERVEAVARFEDSTLYAIEWHTERATFLNGLEEAGGTILEAYGSSTFTFTVRFNDHAALTRFHRFYQGKGFPVSIRQVYTLSEGSEEDGGFDLTPAQREALVVAVENGYFAVPRRTKLEEVADELDISRQAVSELVRRGTEKVLQRALFDRSPTGGSPSDEG